MPERVSTKRVGVIGENALPVGRCRWGSSRGIEGEIARGLGIGGRDIDDDRGCLRSDTAKAGDLDCLRGVWLQAMAVALCGLACQVG